MDETEGEKNRYAPKHASIRKRLAGTRDAPLTLRKWFLHGPLAHRSAILTTITTAIASSAV